jgi:crotonobetainyl-CoA:carnitine CoA-transferase CaiB-like acyl-CoA transferase
VSLPLAGVKILDFTHLLPGELCSTMLSDLGCEIVRLESIGSRLASQLPPIVEGESLYYWSIHRNKKRIAVDLKNPQGLELARRLIQSSDALLENFRPGVMKRLGLSYTDAQRLNPRIIYCSISGYGQENSYSGRPGHDLNFLAESGILDAGTSNGDRPTIPGALVSDYTSALYAALAVVSHLLAVGKNGQGKHIDISMFESALSTQQIMATSLMYLGLTRDKIAFRYPAELPHYSVYQCKDGKYLAIAPLEGQFWKTFCHTTGNDELAEMQVQPQDPELVARLQLLFRGKTLDEWMKQFAGTNCCVSPVNSVSEALQSAPAKERNIVSYLEHPKLGAIPQIANPMLSLEERQVAHQSVATSDSQAVALLNQAGYDQTAIDQLCRDGVIQFRHVQL